MDLDWFVKEVSELSERLQIAVDRLPPRDENQRWVPALCQGQKISERLPAIVPETETYSIEEQNSELYKSLNGATVPLAVQTGSPEAMKSTRAKWAPSSSPVILAKEEEKETKPNTAFEIPVRFLKSRKSNFIFSDNTSSSQNKTKAQFTRHIGSSKTASSYNPRRWNW